MIAEDETIDGGVVVDEDEVEDEDDLADLEDLVNLSEKRAGSTIRHRKRAMQYFSDYLSYISKNVNYQVIF